jgi:hypothetical protein
MLSVGSGLVTWSLVTVAIIVAIDAAIALVAVFVFRRGKIKR